MERFYDQVQPLLPLSMVPSPTGSRATMDTPTIGISGDKRMRALILIVICLLLTSVLLICFSFLPPNILSFVDPAKSNGSTELHYSVVIDAGSSGSRAYLYTWPTHSGNPNELLKLTPLTGENGKPIYKKVTPGLSSLREKPYEALLYITPLLEFALEHIPPEKVRETPLYILATTGMRMLSSKEQDDILTHLREGILQKYQFLFPEGNLEIITGKQEGIYQWLAINYVLGKFRHSETPQVISSVRESGEDGLILRPRTVGAIDMGGASMQIAMEITSALQLEGLSEQEKNQVVEINLGCKDHDVEHTYRVFVTTFLGYGANEAMARHRRNLILSQIVSNTSIIQGLTSQQRIKDPCLPFHFDDSVTINLDPNMYHIPFNLSDNFGPSTQIHLTGTGNWRKCFETLKDFAKTKEPFAKCEGKNCPDAGIKIPSIQFENSEFFAFSEFWYSMEDVLKMGGPYIHSKFESAAKHFCETPWELTWNRFNAGQFRNADRQRMETQCFKSNWLTVALHEGFDFPDTYSHLSAAPETVNGKVVHWTLGALLYRTRFLPLRAIESKAQERVHHGPYHSAFASGYLYSHYIVLLCLIFVIIAIIVYLDRLKRYIRPSTFRKVPSVPFWPPTSNGYNSRLDVEAAQSDANNSYQHEDLLIGSSIPSGGLKHDYT
ncbi:ectonucleoside triphosphate diphosphohydrolase 7-like isoform X2 [Tigriopus californicus]|uniref:ectonucleoside triphosphate diphosphohydrolase 7-like isoform X2 n=1 Tax=Tigriopus californicus TaxID=6832 RepID=UPI0027D9DE7C|nr:ectonucleoside triphosphate diphosphohydrolase 7-like isoform X2 [Tigriopus californicus]